MLLSDKSHSHNAARQPGATWGSVSRTRQQKGGSGLCFFDFFLLFPNRHKHSKDKKCDLFYPLNRSILTVILLQVSEQLKRSYHGYHDAVSAHQIFCPVILSQQTE